MRWRGNVSVGDGNQQAPFSNEELQYLYLSDYGTVDPMVWRNGFVLILFVQTLWSSESLLIHQTQATSPHGFTLHQGADPRWKSGKNKHQMRFVDLWTKIAILRN